MGATRVAIMVATHKSYDFPEDSGYMPIHLGKAINPNSLGIQGDNSGENISVLNKSFCELTGLYWLWKNQDADYYGLVHYRRYFKPAGDSFVTVRGKSIACSYELVALMKDYDVILSRKRCYVIDTVRSHFMQAHNASDYDAMKTVISEKYPEYSAAFVRVMGRRSVSLYNMFVMPQALFNAYSLWLFDILFELEKRIPYSEYGSYQRRVFGFLGERLLNVWVEHHRNSLKVKYLPVVNIEGENLFLKAIGLLKRKFLGAKVD